MLALLLLYHLIDVVTKLNLQSIQDDAKDQIRRLWKMFQGIDATQVEINPWATDPKVWKE